MAASQEYGAGSENLLIGILAFIIILCFGLVIWLNIAVAKPCTEDAYIYCGSQATHSEPEEAAKPHKQP